MIGNTNAKIGGSGSDLQLGDRLLGIASFVTYFTPTGIYDTDSLKYLFIKQKEGNTLTDLEVNKTLWLAQIETTLQIITPKGKRNIFNFTYNGSTWDLFGATTVSGISASDLTNVYGITFTGTPAENDVIEVTEKHYRRFACYVLDSTYRGLYAWKTGDVTPTYSSTPYPSSESATYYNNIIWNTVSPLTESPTFNFAKSFGDITLPNGIKVNVLIPNADEMKAISDNMAFLDTIDEAQVSGNMLSDRIGSGHSTAVCQQSSSSNNWYWRNGSYFENALKRYDNDIITVLEVPSM